MKRSLNGRRRKTKPDTTKNVRSTSRTSAVSSKKSTCRKTTSKSRVTKWSRRCWNNNAHLSFKTRIWSNRERRCSAKRPSTSRWSLSRRSKLDRHKSSSKWKCSAKKPATRSALRSRKLSSRRNDSKSKTKSKRRLSFSRLRPILSPRLLRRTRLRTNSASKSSSSCNSLAASKTRASEAKIVQTQANFWNRGRKSPRSRSRTTKRSKFTSGLPKSSRKDSKSWKTWSKVTTSSMRILL